MYNKTLAEKLTLRFSDCDMLTIFYGTLSSSDSLFSIKSGDTQIIYLFFDNELFMKKQSHVGQM